MTIIYAHRGASQKCPENTMVAFKQAEKDGTDGIEMDVHLTKDGVPVVIHDETVDRTSDGNGFVKDYTLNAIKKLNMGSWKSSQYSAEKILTLEEFLDWIAPTSLLINIELKNNIFSYKGMEKSVLNMVEERDLLNRTVFSSFNHESLYKLHLLNIDAETAPLFAKPIMVPPWDYCRELGAKGIHPYFRHVSSQLIDDLHDHNLVVRPYTVNNPRFMRMLLNWRSDAIITDQPWMAATLRQHVQ